MRQAMLVAKPVDPIIEAEERGPILYCPEPLGETTAGCRRDTSDEVLVGLLRVV
jgi:hypothetical protein